METKIDIEIKIKVKERKDISIEVYKNGKKEMTNHIVFNTVFGAQKYVDTIWDQLMAGAICSHCG